MRMKGPARNVYHVYPTRGPRNVSAQSSLCLLCSSSRVFACSSAVVAIIFRLASCFGEHNRQHYHVIIAMLGKLSERET